MNTERPARARTALRLGAGVAAAAMTLTACGGGSSTSGASAAGSGNSTITIGTTFPPGTLDPTVGTQGSDLGYLDFVFDTLIKQNPQTGALEPMLATSWKYMGTDNLELAVFLRHGVTFQDGTPFNAAAVVSYSTAFIKAGDIANLLQYVTNVTAVGNDEVIYHLSQQNAELPYGLTGRAGMIPSPTAVAKEGKSFATDPVGAGPFKFVSETQGASYNFTSFPGYWNNANLPRAKNMDFKVFQSDTALVNAVRSGIVNVAFHVTPQDVATLKSDSNVNVSVGPGNAFALAYFNSARSPPPRSAWRSTWHSTASPSWRRSPTVSARSPPSRCRRGRSGTSRASTRCSPTTRPRPRPSWCRPATPGGST